MTSENVKNTCVSAGLVNTCVGGKTCAFSKFDCTVTSLTGCKDPMSDFSKAICNGKTPNQCPVLDGVYTYMEKDGESCGVEGQNWCANPSRENRWAICAKLKGK